MKGHRRASVLRIAVVASLSLLASRALALTPPGGSYTQSCNGVFFDGATLSATCSDGRGTWYWSSLMTAACSDDIANVGGHLYCSGGEPGGSYLNSCYGFTYYLDIEGRPTITASCSDGRGVYESTELDLSYCFDAPANILGSLSCAENGGAGVFPPAGSYRQSCRGPSVSAENGWYWLYAECRDIHGIWGGTVLDNPQQCKGDIWNSNGALGCNR